MEKSEFVLKVGYGETALIPIDTQMLSSRVLFVEDDITSGSADLFVKQLAYLCQSDATKPITVVINSKGGEITAGLKMCDALEACPVKVNAFCFGKAYSMAAVVFESCSGTRNVVGRSKLMLHQPLVMGGDAVKKMSDIEDMAKELQQKQEEILDIVAKRSTLSRETMKEKMKEDWYLSADEAIALGLADHKATFSDVFGLVEEKE